MLAWILKYTLEEFGDDEIPEIMNHLSQPVISSIRMEPGQTNRDKIEKQSEEDVVIGEGKIYYDIRFSAYHGEEQIKILVNIEAQKSTSPSKLGYHLDNRIIYYLGRMISAQKEVEFTKSEYDQLKAVRSIWICMDTADEEDSINRIRFVQEIVYGKEMKLANIDKVQGIIIRLRSNENVEKSKNILIAMLEEYGETMKSYGIKKIEDKKKKYIDRMFILRQHLSGGALWSILRKLLKRKPEQNKMFVYESRFVDSEIVVSVVVPLYNTPQQYLRAMIESVLEQTYL